MADQLLYLTELLGLKVFDLKGRRIGVVKDAALVPLVESCPRRGGLATCPILTSLSDPDASPARA